MVPCSWIVWGDLWAKIFRIFFSYSLHIYSTPRTKKMAYPPWPLLEGFGVAPYLTQVAVRRVAPFNDSSKDSMNH